MPPKGMSRSQRREITLRALRSESAASLAAEYGLSRQRIYQLKTEAEQEREAEYAHWRRVREILGPKPILEMPDLDALVHTLETADDLPPGPYHIYERGDATTDGWYVALLSETDAAGYSRVGVV